MSTPKDKIVYSMAGAGSGLSGLLMGSCAGACTACFGCFGGGGVILLLVLIRQLRTNAVEDNIGMVEDSH